MKKHEEQVAIKKEDVVEYSNFLKDMVGTTLQDSDCESNYSEESSDEEEKKVKDEEMDGQVHGI